MKTLIAIAAVLVAATSVRADTPLPLSVNPRGAYVAGPKTAAAGAAISPYVYLNRCTGGCRVSGTAAQPCGANGLGPSDARTMTSGIPMTGTYMVGEFANGFAQTGSSGMGTCLNPDNSMTTMTCTNDAGCASLGAGALCDTADYEWGLVVQCMKEIYSPFAVTVQDTAPTGGVSYTEAVIAGRPGDIGCSNGFGGIAPIMCGPQDNVMSFSFANTYGGYGQQRAFNICATAGQETAHAFGLDHEYQFLSDYPNQTSSDGAKTGSTCIDPMTYQSCGLGDNFEKFFRNSIAYCGEFMKRDCFCGGTQNSHDRILSVFGPGTPITKPPSIAITAPMMGDTIAANAAIQSTGGAQRGILKLELSVNGYVWVTVPGDVFGGNGQPYGAQPPLVLPNGVPNSIVDLVVKAYDDLGTETDSATVTATLGAPCADATTCAKGQQCEAGKCFWPPPTGNLGDSCTYDQFCMSNQCVMTTNGSFCTQTCLLGVADVCPAGYDCAMGSDPNNGFCLKTAKAGCCSASGDNGALAHFALGVGVLGFAMRRRRRRS